MIFKSDSQRKAVFSRLNNRFALYRDSERPYIVRSDKNPQVEMKVPVEYRYFEDIKKYPDEWFSGLKKFDIRFDTPGGTYYRGIDLDKDKERFIDHNRRLVGVGGWDEEKLGDYWEIKHRKNKEDESVERPYISLFYDVPSHVVKHEILHHVAASTLETPGEALPETMAPGGRGWGLSEHFKSLPMNFTSGGYAAALMHLKNPTYKELEAYESGDVPNIDMEGIKEDFGKMLDVDSPSVRGRYNELMLKKK